MDVLHRFGVEHRLSSLGRAVLESCLGPYLVGKLLSSRILVEEGEQLLLFLQNELLELPIALTSFRWFRGSAAGVYRPKHWPSFATAMPALMIRAVAVLLGSTAGLV